MLGSPIKITPETLFQTEKISLSLAELWELEPICVFGLPSEMSEEMRDAVQTLVCLAVSPLMGGFPPTPDKEDLDE